MVYLKTTNHAGASVSHIMAQASRLCLSLTDRKYQFLQA